MNKETLMKKKINELRNIARDLSIKFPATLKKSELVLVILDKIAAKEEISPAAVIPLPAAGPQRVPSPGPYDALPAGYGGNRIRALVRDPAWIFVYWEMSTEGFSEGHRRLRDPEARLTLRIFDLTAMQDLSVFFDIEVYHQIGNWYIDVGQGGRTYLADIGLKSRNGSFATVARSNPVTTPPGRLSEDLSEEWWIVENGKTAQNAVSEPGSRLPQEVFARQEHIDQMEWVSSGVFARLAQR